MTIFDRFNIKVIVCAGLCVAAIALSPDAAAAPLKTGGYECIQGAAAASPVAAGGPVAAADRLPPPADRCPAAAGPAAGPVVPDRSRRGPVPAAGPVPPPDRYPPPDAVPRARHFLTWPVFRWLCLGRFLRR